MKIGVIWANFREVGYLPDIIDILIKLHITLLNKWWFSMNNLIGILSVCCLDSLRFFDDLGMRFRCMFIHSLCCFSILSGIDVCFVIAFYHPTGAEVVESWYSEIKDHVFGKEPKSMGTGMYTGFVFCFHKNQSFFM